MRCSGHGQVSGDTWERQSAAITRYAESQGIELVGEYRDEGISGKTDLENRPGLAACLERIENNGVKLVLVEDASRLARDSMVAELVVREFQKVGGRIIAASGGVDLTEGDDSNPTAKLIRQILAAISEFDRSVIVLKLRAARQRKKSATGRCEGRKPFGSTPEERSILDEMLSMKRDGIGPNDISDYLNAKRKQTRFGGRWYPGTVAKIIRREAARHTPVNA
jgi:DNA invertase Pin-like site-specific DNA recombinase